MEEERIPTSISEANPNVSSSPSLTSTNNSTEGRDHSSAGMRVKSEMSAETMATTETEESSNAPTENGVSFDNSDRKVIIMGIFKHFNGARAEKDIRAWIQKNKAATGGTTIQIQKVKKPPKVEWACVTLKEASMVPLLVNLINSDDSLVDRRGRKVKAQPADQEEDSMSRKRAEDGGEDGRAEKRRKTIEESRRPVTEEEIKDALIPLHKISRQEQLETKYTDMLQNCVLKLVKEVKKRFREINREADRRKDPIKEYPWLTKRRPIYLEQIQSAPSPVRNKCEFNFGWRYEWDGSQSTGEKRVRRLPGVGSNVLGWAGGVANPTCCDNIPAEACQIIDLLNKFLEESPIPPYDNIDHSGLWRTLTFRSSRRTNECLLIIQHSPASPVEGMARREDYSIAFETEKERLLGVLKGASLEVPEHDPMKITSIFFQEYAGLSNPSPEHPVQHAYGKKTLTEKLGNCTFQVSPGAFFQVNTEGAEILYTIAMTRIQEIAPQPEDTLLFDVCCGTGTIGLFCMKEGAAGKVVGIDISEPAIEDAKNNAILNGFEETGAPGALTKFISGRAEDVMSQEIQKAKETGMKFVAVVDPAREGLHAGVIKALRATRRIQRIVYVSCNPTGSLVRDAVLLCQPGSKKYKGNPFKVSHAVPVDMFPLTNHCEMVMTFDRLLESELEENAEE